MPEQTSITIPLINPNEPEALLASLLVREGEHVTAGQVLCILETTKATQELQAEREGYVVGLRFATGQTVRAGDTLAFLAESPDWSPPEDAAPPVASADQEGVPAGLRITRPALVLARDHGLELASLPTGPLVTEDFIRGLLPGVGIAESIPSAEHLDPTTMIIYGGGGHGKSLIELIHSLGTFQLVGVVDDGLPPGETVLGLPVVGGGGALKDLYARGVRLAVNAVGGIGNVSIRVEVFQRLAGAGFACPSVVHPASFIESSADLAEGTQVFPHAYVGSDVRVGFGAIVNTAAVVSHDCTIGEYANISPGALLAGGVIVGARALVGMGVTVNLGVTVGDGARVGNGATVKADVPAGGLVRAGAIWPE